MSNTNTEYSVIVFQVQSILHLCIFFKYVFQMHVFTILHSTLHVYFMQAVYLQLF